MSKIKVLVAFFVALALSLPLAFAKTESEINEAIEDAIHQRHPSFTADWWRALGPETPHLLIQKYQTNSDSYQQLRLLEALAWFNDPEATQFLKDIASRADNDVLRQSAVRTLGLSQGEKEEDFISKFLKNPDPQTRVIAAEALKRMKSSSSQKALDTYLKEEKTPWVVARLRGERLAGPTKLQPVASSEDRVSALFVGHWKGVAVAPLLAPKDGWMNAAASIRFEEDLSGELILEVSKGIYKTVQLKQVKGKASVVKGVIQGWGPGLDGGVSVGGAKTTAGGAEAVTSTPPQQNKTVSFEAIARTQNGVSVLEMRIPEKAMIVLGRR